MIVKFILTSSSKHDIDLRRAPIKTNQPSMLVQAPPTLTGPLLLDETDKDCESLKVGHRLCRAHRCEDSGNMFDQFKQKARRIRTLRKGGECRW